VVGSTVGLSVKSSDVVTFLRNPFLILGAYWQAAGSINTSKDSLF
jgi:hypothetical protein